jgi:AraC-like DNA-binding protein
MLVCRENAKPWYQWSPTGRVTGEQFCEALNVSEYYCSLTKREHSPTRLEMLMRPLKSSTLISCRTNMCNLHRSSREIRNIDDPKINFTYICSGSENIVFNDEININANAGDLLILPNYVSLDCGIPESLHKITLTIPKLKTKLLMPDIEMLYGSKISLASGIGSIAAATFQQAEQQITSLEPGMREELLDLIILLVENCISFKTSIYLSKSKEYLFGQACSYIEKNIEDSELNQQAIAQALGVSRRYLQQIFSLKGYTINGYIQDARLDLCRKALIHSRKKNRSISEIVYQSGIDDLSYFIKLFRKKYGMTPSQYRAGFS